MFSLIQLKTMTLDAGIPGISPTHMLLIFAMVLAIPMIPYFFLYLSLQDHQARQARASKAPHVAHHNPFGKLAAWLHAHRHPALLHH
jgi:hypothetical protein